MIGAPDLLLEGSIDRINLERSIERLPVELLRQRYLSYMISRDMSTTKLPGYWGAR